MTPEERIKAATEAVLASDDFHGDPTDADVATRIILAKLSEDFSPKPKWPTDESVDRFKAAYESRTHSDFRLLYEWVRDCLREAMTPDPIIKAALAWRHDLSPAGTEKLKRAIDEAEL